jgi:hypothetical protein
MTVMAARNRFDGPKNELEKVVVWRDILLPISN